LRDYFRTWLEKTPPAAVSLFPRLLCRAIAEGNRLYLTFDDGPHPEYTPPVLDLLEDLGIRATFFLIGRRAERHPDLVRRIAERHGIANHTWDHLNLRWQNASVFAQQLEPTRILLETLAAKPVQFFRPPYGAFGPALVRYARQHGHQIVLWEVLPWDFVPQRTTEQISNAILRHAAPGSIIVLHDGHRCVSKTLPALRFGIPILLERGFVFDVLPAWDVINQH